MKINVSDWNFDAVMDYLAAYRGHIELTGETVWLHFQSRMPAGA